MSDEHTTYDPHAAEAEHQGDKPVEHAGFEGTEPTAPDADGLDAGDEPISIVDEWAGDYPAGTQLFCAKFDADDFDHSWGEGDYSEGATVAIKRGTGTPSEGWILRHAHLNDGERTKLILREARVARRAHDPVLAARFRLRGVHRGMGEGRRDAAGKIQQVCAAVREQEAALRRDVLALGSGYRLDDGRLSWDDLHAVIYAAPPGTSLYHSLEQGWLTSDYLLAIIADGVHDLIWQKTKDGRKNRRRPKRLPRPKRESNDGTASTGLGRVSVMTVEEFEKKRQARMKAYVERKARERRAAQKGD